jgi:hypothetical protein
MLHLLATSLFITSAVAIADDTWWSCHPLTQPTIPGDDVDGHPIDRFLAGPMQDLGLTPADPADPRTLVRRATFDLTGLPPSIDTIETYRADPTPEHWNDIVDALLASDQYGVKWGRHWLDLVRWAETDSFERDNRKPEAWRYRDWVVDAFNRDMPYDRFILEQLAGDELPDRSLSSIIATGYYRLGIWDDEPTDIPLAQYDDLDGILDTTSRVMLGMSMGCARCHDHKKDPIPQVDYYSMLAFFHGITPYKSTPGNAIHAKDFTRSVPDHIDRPELDQQRIDEWTNERARLVEAITASHAQLLESPAPPVERNGLVLTADSDVEAVDRMVEDDFTVEFEFRTSTDPNRGNPTQWWTGQGLVNAEVPGVVPDWGLSLVRHGRIVAGTGKPELSIASQEGYDDGQWHHVAFTRQRNTGEVILYIDGEPVAEGTGSTEALDAPKQIQIGSVLPNHLTFDGDIRNVKFWDRTQPHRTIIDLSLGLSPLPSAPGSPEHELLVEQLVALRRPIIPHTTVLCVLEPDTTPPTTHVLDRGNPHVPLDAVDPAFPVMLGGGAPTSIEPTDESSGRRLALARWIIRPENLRTARVMVNRLWQHHFGTGLVPTPNEFGTLGLPPTHPALLDWLAVEFIDSGWSVKAMHRLIMSSAAYQRGSIPVADARQRDPLDTALSWYPPRRLTAEELRDSILATNGTLNLQLGGPSVYPPMPEEVLATSSRPDAVWGRSSPEQADRRSIYIHLKRSLLDPLLTAFDLADTDTTCPVRFVTTQPTQALTMLNSDFTGREAAQLGDRLRAEGSTTEDHIRLGIRAALGRDATVEEIQDAIVLLDTLQQDHGLNPQQALDRYCLVLLNLNEFIYVD